MRLRTVLTEAGRKKSQGSQFFMSDYVAVPAIDTVGRWDIKDLIPTDQLARLAGWANKYEANQSKTFGRMTVIGKGRR